MSAFLPIICTLKFTKYSKKAVTKEVLFYLKLRFLFLCSKAGITEGGKKL